jgi:hypothetical protein
MCESNIMWRGNSKTTSNTVSIVVDNVTTSTINAASGTVGTLTTTTSYTTDTFTQRLFIDNNAFLYSTGSWEPTFELINSDGTGVTLIYQKQDGYFIRSGSQVTVYFDLEFTLKLGAGVSNADKFAAIGNLPFEIGGPISDGKVQVSHTASTVSFPNGFAGPVPAIALPVFSGPFNYNAYETGLVVPLSVSFVGYGTWPSDGRKLLIRCTQTIYTVIVSVPPYAEAYSTEGNTSFLWFSTDTTFPCQFSGSICYAIA